MLCGCCGGCDICLISSPLPPNFDHIRNYFAAWWVVMRILMQSESLPNLVEIHVHDVREPGWPSGGALGVLCMFRIDLHRVAMWLVRCGFAFGRVTSTSYEPFSR